MDTIFTTRGLGDALVATFTLLGGLVAIVVVTLVLL